MKELVYLADSLDEVESATHELEQQGIPHNAIRVFSEDDAGVKTHHLESVPEWEKRDLLRRGLMGAAVGLVLAVGVLVFAQTLQWYQTVTWMPFVFLAIVLAGFCTWEGGLIGALNLNHRFESIKDKLKSGAHLVLVKVDSEKAEPVDNIVKKHKGIVAVKI